MTQVPFVTGGAEHLQDHLQRVLQRAGHEVELVSIPFEFEPARSVLTSMRCWEAQDWNALRGVDLAICTRFPSFYLRHRNKVVWLFHQHRPAYDLFSDTDNSMPARLRAAILRRDREHLARASKICAISQNVSRRLRLYSNIESMPLCPPPPLAEQIWSAPAEPYVFLPSRVEPLKRQSLLIEAMRHVRAPVRAVICGEGSAAKDCRELIEARGLSARIDFLGHIEAERLLSCYARCLAVVYPPKDEDLGLVTLEAMLAHKPVLCCSDSGGPLEFVRHRATGLVLPPEPEALAAAIDELYARQQWAQEMGTAAYKAYRDAGITWARVLEQLVPPRVGIAQQRPSLVGFSQPAAWDSTATSKPSDDLSAEEFAREAYRRILNREIDAGALCGVLAGLAAGRTRTEIVLDLATSEESRRRLLSELPVSGRTLAAGMDDAPSYLQVESTTRCNADCAYCRRTLSHGTPAEWARDLPEEFWPEVIRYSTRVGYVRLHGFGEPLCYPRLLDKMRTLDALGVSTGFSTNGISLPRYIDQLAELKHLLHVNVSVDSPDPKVYRRSRGGDLSRVTAGLKTLSGRLPATTLSVSVVATEETLPTICDFPAYLRSLDIHNLIVQDLNEKGPGLNRQAMSRNANLPENFARLRSECATAGIALNVGPTLAQTILDTSAPDASVPALSRQCNWPFDSLYVDSKGDVFPCCLAVDGPPIGHLGSESLDEIWHGERLHEFRRSLLEGSAPEVCRYCLNALAGPHPLATHSCSILSIVAAGDQPCAVQIQVRNTGQVAWGQSVPVRVGTARPRERSSPGRLGNWIGPSRPCGPDQSIVAPGNVGTFTFQIDAQASQGRECFQLLVEGQTWLPGSEFFLDFRGTERRARVGAHAIASP